MASSPAPPLAATGWSSSLSVAEHAAVREAGFTPQGLVMGSSVYKLGVSYSPQDYYSYAYGPRPFGGAPMGGGPFGGGPGGGGPWSGTPTNAPWAGAPRGRYGAPGGYRPGLAGAFPGWLKYYSASDLGLGGGWAGTPGLPFGGWGGMVGAVAVCWERSTFEDGIEDAARLALGRMVAETKALAGHGVVGVRLAFRYLEGLPSTIEFTALGTAVMRPGAPPLDPPFTSHLDGQALLKLVRAGMVPVAAAVGAGSVMAQMPRLTLGTQELGPFGDAIEASRRIASERLVRAARSEGWAVLGTLASSSTYGEGEGEVATTVLTGTVVRRFASGSWDHLPLPVMRLSRP
ncbi:MAG TPA: heavy metal-binding domain-containing protein [Acidimicrobiales bacterium]|nr:heavy metal-binding domain-containing protein [Acidimicrobiales bacterium]